MHYLTRPNRSIVFFLEPTDYEEVISVCKTISTNAAGIDNISKNIVGKMFPTLALHLFEIINLSFEKGIVPRELKLAKITPFYKSGSQRV